MLLRTLVFSVALLRTHYIWIYITTLHITCTARLTPRKKIKSFDVLCSYWMLCWSVRMFKGGLLSKGGHLTRRFAEVMLILLCCPTIILFFGLSFWPSGRFFSHFKSNYFEKTQRSDINNWILFVATSNTSSFFEVVAFKVGGKKPSRRSVLSIEVKQTVWNSLKPTTRLDFNWPYLITFKCKMGKNVPTWTV